MNEISLIKYIREEFKEVEFPFHCGLHAAMAKDDWVDDEKTLKKITQDKDYIGKWWDVPAEHLLECIMALNYLDSQGMVFYLPAYMASIIKEPILFDKPKVRSSSWQVVWTMNPDKEDREMELYFYERFSKINRSKKLASLEFLKYVAKCDKYQDEAREIAYEALSSEFWKIDS